MVQCIRDWATAFPDELVAFDRQMKQRRELGMYRGEAEAMASFAEVPTRLHAMMSTRIKRNWLHDSKLANLFFSHFKVGLMRKNDRLPEANLRESS